MVVSPVAALRSSLAVVAVTYLLMASQTVSARPATKRGLLQVRPFLHRCESSPPSRGETQLLQLLSLGQTASCF